MTEKKQNPSQEKFKTLIGGQALIEGILMQGPDKRAIVVRGPVIVGRNPGADIVIGAGYVSGRHARFSLMGQNLFVEDLGSTNGTAVNGQFINEPTALRNGDTVNVGDVAIRVRFA